MNRHWARIVLWWGTWALWCGLIYFVSANPTFTGEHTRQVIQEVVPVVVSDRPELVRVLNVLLRKSGHVLGFAILGGLSLAAVSAWPRPRRAAVWAWTLASLYAASDELHQAHVPGRSGTVWDVALDAAAAVLGVTFTVRITQRRRASGIH